MKLVIAAVGRLKPGPERELAAHYRARALKAGRAVGLRGLEIVEIAESRARRAPDRLAEENLALGAILPENAAIVALDADGEGLSSTHFAARLGQWRMEAKPATAFLIGGADGLAAAIKAGAQLRLAFGAATWPHQLVRIMLLEQIYRAVTILAGHPYHRG
jgi:23S rRNA (pseudouridine1915-N3)-methyltransferase